MSHSAALPLATSSLSSQFKSRCFFGVLAIVTAAPIFWLPFHLGGAVSSRLNGLLFFIWIITGYGHVASTVWFGFDRDYGGLVRSYWPRTLLALAVLPLVAGAIALSSAAAAGWFFAAYILWQAHHYNRQNYGLLSFASGHDRFGPLPAEIVTIFQLTTAAGAIRMVTMPSIFLGLAPFRDPVFAHFSWYIAVALFVAAGIMIARLLIANPRLRQSPTTLMFLGLSYVFFLPSLFSGSSNISFLPYAIAHGAQYLVMIGVTSRNSRLGLAGLGLAACLTIVLAVVGNNMTGVPWAHIYTGVVIWHFLVDARLWRLRDPAVRAIVKSRFGFIYG